MKTKHWMNSLCALAALTCVALAQTPPRGGVIENRYRVGIDCAPISEPLQVHLNLDEGTGLIVNRVMPESPADKVGVKRLDIIIAANGKPVGQVAELVRAVNDAKSKKMTFTLIRRGEELALDVTPEERDPAEIEQIRRGFRNRIGAPDWNGFGQLPPQVLRQLEQFGPMDIFPGDDRRGGRAFRRVLPGIIMDRPMQPLPHGFDLNIQVERNDDGPAKIRVEHGGKSWEVDEENLDELPDDIRPMVENMLRGRSSGWSGLMIPPAQGQPSLRRPAGPQKSDDKKLQNRFDVLELQIQELQNAIRSLGAAEGD